MTQETVTDVWTSCKELQQFIENVVSKPVHGVLKQLEEILRNHKQDFLTLLTNPPKNAQHREDIKKALADGTALPGFRHNILTKEIVDEAIILSDMFELHEYVALDLLFTAQQQMPNHPGLPRGLVAILLYYDGRKALVNSLKALVQARRGITWTLNTSEEVARYITFFTKELVDHHLLSHIVDLLETLDVTREIDLLHQNRALGGPRHHRHVVDLYEDTRQGLAEILFCWAAQCGLPQQTTMKLINFLKTTKMEDDATGVMDNVSVTMTMALLYGLDLSVLQTKEDGEELAKTLPVLSDEEFIPALMKEFIPMEKTWETPGIQGLVYLAWALSICALRYSRLVSQSFAASDEDDILVDSANELNVFDFLRRSFLPNQMIYREEFFLRRIHNIITDFIVYMPMKVKEMKNRSDESARTIQAYIQEGLEPPHRLPHHFEHLLLTVARLYQEDPLKLDLVLDFWAPAESYTNESVPFRSHPRQVALYKFVRLGGDILPPAVFVPYMKMLRSLANSPQAARCAFNFLKMNGSGTATVSWTHFFKSLGRYYNNLRQELPPTTDTVYQPRSFPRGILPQEIQGLQAVLGVVRTVAENDATSRVNMADHPNWTPVPTLLGLVACAVPIPLKAELLLTLTALAKSASVATGLWYSLESSQIFATVPSTSSYQPRGVQTELEEIESRNEEFPLTRAVLRLLDVLTDVPVPKLLGVENRPPGFDPYLNFIVFSVFLRFNTRIYKNPDERWEVAQSCLVLLNKFLTKYTPNICDFTARHVELHGGASAQVNSPPGYHIMINFNKKTELLRLVLFLIDEGAHTFETFSPVAGQSKLEATVLSCLDLLGSVLEIQDHFFELLTCSGSSLLLAGLRRLLLDVNPRSGNPDHLLNISKYVVFSSWLPSHALSAAKILMAICWTPSAQNHLLSLYTSSSELTMTIRHGFVEALELDDDQETDDDHPSVQCRTKEVILKLLQQCLHYSEPNISHFLLGFDLKKVQRTVFQQPGVLCFPRTCFHALLSILDGSLMKRVTPYASRSPGSLLESSYRMIYLLSSDSKTSGPVLRFLRSCSDFLYRHVSHFPFTGPNDISDMSQMGWLLKTVAVELKSTFRNDQLSTLTNLVNLLTREQGDTPIDPDNEEAFENEDENLSQYLSRKKSHDELKTHKQRMVLSLLNFLDFQVASTPQPEWEYFVPKQVEELGNRCEVTAVGGQKFVDIKKVHRLMLEDLNYLQSATSAGQRTMVVAEIENILRFFVELNKDKARCHATVTFMDAWRQVTEMLFCVCPRNVLPEDVRLGLLVDCLHIVLKKVLSQQVIPELAALSSGVVLLLSVALQQCLLACQYHELVAVAVTTCTPGASTSIANSLSSDTTLTPTPIPTYTSLNIPGRPGIFDTVLSNILEWIINSGVTSQKLRTHLYGALLMFVRMVCRDATQQRADLEVEAFRIKGSNFVSRLDASMYRVPGPESQRRRQACLEVIMGFGEGLVDVLCHDCTGGHDVCKMLALSCLGLLVEFDPHSTWIAYITSRGYLRHIIDSLLDSDLKLCELLGTNPRTLSALFVYESKMAMLCRVASTRAGAEIILEQNCFTCLAAMTVFNKHPDFKSQQHSSETSFIPSPRSRYQQILFPALNLCDAILTTLGQDNLACCLQIRSFLYSHYEMLSIVLHCGSPLSQAKFLNELARITGIIARVSHHADKDTELFDENLLPLARHYTAHIATWMMELIQHFIISESMIRELRGNVGAQSPGIACVTGAGDSNESQTDSAVLYFLQVACNLLLFARNVVSGSVMDRRTTQPIFSVQFEEICKDEEEKDCEKDVNSPPLGRIVKQLEQCVSYHQREKANLDLLMHKKLSISSSNVDLAEALLESVKDESYTTDSQNQASRALDKQIRRKLQEMELCTFLIDNCLYLIWCHLDFYLYQVVQLAKQGVASYIPGIRRNPDVSSLMMISKEEINALKQGVVSSFNDSFTKQLLDTQKDRSATDKGFVEALLKRIKRLIQFAPPEIKL